MRYWCNNCNGFFATSEKQCDKCGGSDIDGTMSTDAVNKSIRLYNSHEHGGKVAMLVAGQQVEIKGEEYIGQYFDGIEKIVSILASAMPDAISRKDTQFKCKATAEEFIFGLYHDEDSTRELTFEFTITDGGKDLHIDRAVLGSELQNAGLMKPMMKGATEIMELAKTQVEKISLHANIDVGGYAWSRYGFMPDNPEEEVEALKGKITRLLDTHTIEFDDHERTVEFSGDGEESLRELLRKIDEIKPSSDKDPIEQAHEKFQLLANVQTKITVHASKVGDRLFASAIPGGGTVGRLLGELDHWEMQLEENEKAKGELAKRLDVIKQKIVVFSDALSKIGEGAEVPGKKYIATIEGKEQIKKILEFLKVTQDLVAAAQEIDGFRLSVTATETELPLSMALMLGSGWEGHVNKDSPEMERLKNYCKPKEKEQK